MEQRRQAAALIIADTLTHLYGKRLRFRKAFYEILHETEAAIIIQRKARDIQRRKRFYALVREIIEEEDRPPSRTPSPRPDRALRTPSPYIAPSPTTVFGK